MKRFLILLASFAFFISCKKTIEKAKEDAVIKIMVSGKWKVTKYIKGDSTVTQDFGMYSFQFHENGTVEALANGTVSNTGTWQGNTTAFTIYSNFANAGYPLALLNGTFQLTKSGQTFVEAQTTIDGEPCLLRLDK